MTKYEAIEVLKSNYPDEYILIGDGTSIDIKPSKTFTIHLPPIKVEMPKRKKREKDNG